MEIVNGYACQNCTDVAKAQKGIDPTGGPDAQPGETKAQAEAKHLEKSKATDLNGVNQPLASGPLGTSVNIQL